MYIIITHTYALYAGMNFSDRINIAYPLFHFPSFIFAFSLPPYSILAPFIPPHPRPCTHQVYSH